MNFPLKNIELNVNDAILLEAEGIVGNNQVLKIEKIDKNLWVSLILDETNYEVEVMLSGKNVKATTCDCTQAKNKSICKHIAATLLTILKLQKEKQALAPPPRSTDRTPKKLTTNAILNQVSTDDLHTFLKDYARNNKIFTLALKARFAGKVQTLNNTEKYDELILSCINNIRKNTRKISLKGMRQILSTLKELHDQVDKHIVTANYIEAFAISKSIFNNVIPILQIDADGKRELNTALSLQFLSFKDMAVDKIPPDLSEKIWSYTGERFLASLFYTYEIPDQFLSILQIMGTTETRQTHLIEMIDEALLEGALLEHTNVNLISTKIAFLEKLGREDEIAGVVNENLAHTDILILAVENALRSNDLSRSRKLALMGLEKEASDNQIAQLEEYLLEISILENDMDATYHFAIERFSKTYDFSFFEVAKKAVGDNWINMREKLVEKFRLGKFSIEKRDIIAKIYAREKMYDELNEYISNIRSLDLLQEYDVKLFEHNNKLTKSLYIEIVESFLKSHIGRQTSQKIRTAVLHLTTIDQKALCKQIVELCRKDFSERHSLMEELEDF